MIHKWTAGPRGMGHPACEMKIKDDVFRATNDAEKITCPECLAVMAESVEQILCDHDDGTLLGPCPTCKKSPPFESKNMTRDEVLQKLRSQGIPVKGPPSIPTFDPISGELIAYLPDPKQP